LKEKGKIEGAPEGKKRKLAKVKNRISKNKKRGKSKNIDMAERGERGGRQKKADSGPRSRKKKRACSVKDDRKGGKDFHVKGDSKSQQRD